MNHRVRFSNPMFLNGTHRTVNSSDEQEVIGNLNPSVTYNFTVEAFNNIGFSSVSEPLSITTAEEGTHIHVLALITYAENC